GGGRGIKVIRGKLEVEESFKTASAEALAAFGDGALFVEKYIEDGRHIEVQILGDAQGNVVHLGERDCSLQRRYQKVAEEAPGLAISQSVRELIRESAVKISKKIGYQNAGTVEFMVDQKTGKFYFLEMNTRIQVEHPVTEMVTGIDLVQAQIKIAGGSSIPFPQEKVQFVGHAIEVRITAENAANSFRPSPGIIAKWRPADGDGVRVDTYGYQGALVPPYYDSLIAKLIVHAPSRVHAIMKMQRALSDFEVEGIDTTIPFLKRLVSELDFVQGNYNTRWLELNLDTLIR
ncbi:MAG: acetyl-CoA carboxylase biotin carboxylase subunit, partial [Alphaproteobacteria bacterium]